MLLAYADDLVIFADSYVQMNKILIVLCEYCKINRLSVNVKKTEIMIFKKGGHITNNKYKLKDDGNNVNIAKNDRFLGIELSQSGIFDLASNLVASKDY